MAAFVGVVGIASALLVASFSLLAPEKASDRQAARNAGVPLPLAPDTAGDESTPRAFYPYSVVPGGVHSTQELTAALADPVVATHYAAVDPAAVRVETVRAPRRVHVSYRVGDKVYWTKRTLLLSPGERILTDGRTEIRSRCGNSIADAPQEPTSDEEPLITEFDRALVAFPGAYQPLMDGEPVPSANLRLAEAPLNEFSDSIPGDEGTLGVPAGSLTPRNIAPGGSTPDGSSTGEPPSSSEPGTPWVDIPDDDGPIVPTDQPPFGGPPSEPQPVPVPEPGSMLLVATGLAGGAWRAWRHRRLNGTRPRPR